jgi:hypothetical protein
MDLLLPIWIYLRKKESCPYLAELGTSDKSIDISIFDTYRIQKKVSKYRTINVSEYRISYCNFSLPILRYCIELSKKYRTKNIDINVKPTESTF